MAVEGTKLRLSIPGARSADERWRRACKIVLGVDPAVADRLFAALPRTVVVVGGAAARARLAAQLAKEAVAVEIDPAAVRGEICAVHPRVLVQDECPKCGERTACALCVHGEAVPRCAFCAARARFWTRFKWARVAILLLILTGAAWTTWGAKWRLQSWAKPVVVAIYPIAADPDADVAAFTATLGDAHFDAVRKFMEREGHRFGIDHSDLVQLRIAAPFGGDLPPAPPAGADSKLAIAAWSLKLRLWAFQMKRKHHLPAGDAEIFVLYHASSGEKSLDRSLAVEKIRVGVVHALAGPENTGWTALAITHELLHTLGASDKYGADGMPIFPEGFAEPARVPVLPQRACEVMAGQVPVTDHTFWQPQRVDDCLVGALTAREIGWTK